MKTIQLSTGNRCEKKERESKNTTENKIDCVKHEP